MIVDISFCAEKSFLIFSNACEVFILDYKVFYRAFMFVLCVTKFSSS